jgi:phage terminase large subunit GpA-like protein
VGSSPEPGPWRSKPYQVEVLDACTDATCDGVVYVACSQGGGKTEILLNVAGYYVAHEPSPILVVEPNVEMAEALSKDRVAPMLRSTPVLADLVADARTRDSGNTIRHKEFPGGHLTLVGANSAAGLAMRPIRVVLFDEIDRYPSSAGTEGDPVKLAEARTSAFWNARRVTATSPGLRGGRSWRLWELTDQCEYMVPCHDCGTVQPLRWERVQWDKDGAGEHLPGTAVYVCERCGSAWNDAERWRAVRAGGYRPTAVSRNGWRGFRLPAMAVLGRRLAPMVLQWLEAQGNPEQLKVFKNTVLADWWEEQYETLDETGLASRRELRVEVGGVVEVPAPCPLVTAGVDVQDNRLEVSLWAWGHGEESWLLEHRVLYGDPSAPATWDELDRYLSRPLPRAAGGVDWIRATGLDTGGHHTQAAYDFCGPRFRRQTPDGGQSFVFAMKGFAGTGEVWPRQHSRVSAKVPVWPIRVDPAKEQLYGRLALVDHGPGYVHLPTTVGDDWLAGLVAEKVVTVTDRKGFPVRRWCLKRPGMRNEPLDCAVLAYAALCGLRAMGYDLEDAVTALSRRRVVAAQDATAGGPIAPNTARPAARAPSASGREWFKTRTDWFRR